MASKPKRKSKVKHTPASIAADDFSFTYRTICDLEKDLVVREGSLDQYGIARSFRKKMQLNMTLNFIIIFAIPTGIAAVNKVMAHGNDIHDCIARTLKKTRGSSRSIYAFIDMGHDIMIHISPKDLGAYKTVGALPQTIWKKSDLGI